MELALALLQGLASSLISPVVIVPAIGAGLLSRQWWHVFLGAAIIFVALTAITLLRLPAEARMVWPVVPVGYLPPLVWAAASFWLRSWMRRRNAAQPGNKAVRTVWLLIGLLGGALLGAATGAAIGVAYVELARVSSFEGMSGYLVFLLFMPAGLVIGAAAGGTLAWRLAGRAARAPDPASV